MKQKVIVGMSGGVDSSVAALLLLEQGFDVIGVTMRLWHPEDDGRPEEDALTGLTSVQDAKKVAEVLGIPHYVMNFRDIFREKVVDCFAREYLHARTPNPCIVCNRYVKWEALLKSGQKLGADKIATGHYARIDRLANGRFALRSAAAAEKDQTYALYALTQEQLSRTLMPVGEYAKPEIRRMAAEAGLPVAEKKDSQEICFIPDNDYAAFLKDYTGVSMPEGNFVSPDGTVLGRHRGLYHYTIGQRRGLGLPMGRRVFVREIRPETNEVVVTGNEDLFTSEVKMKNICYMGEAALTDGGAFLGKIRYGHKGTPCRAFAGGPDEITCVFDTPVRAATPGQAMVLYRENHVALGGTIF